MHTKKSSRIAALILSFIAVLSLIMLSSITNVSAATVKVKTVKITTPKYSTLTLSKGTVYTFKTTVSPSNATNKTLKWYTSNSKVASVSSSGKVSAVKNGTATIYCKADGVTSNKVTVTVGTPVSSIKPAKSEITLSRKQTYKIKYTLSPSNSSNKNVKYLSANSSIAKVDSSGTITGVKPGDTTVYIDSADSRKSASIAVKVRDIVGTVTMYDTDLDQSTHKRTIQYGIAENFIISDSVSGGYVTISNCDIENLYVYPDCYLYLKNSKIENIISGSETGATEIRIYDGTVVNSANITDSKIRVYSGGKLNALKCKGVCLLIDTDINTSGEDCTLDIYNSEIPSLTLSGDCTVTATDSELKQINICGSNSSLNLNSSSDTIKSTSVNAHVNIASGASVREYYSNAAKNSISGEGALTTVYANANDTVVTVMGANVTAAAGISGTMAGSAAIAAGQSGKVKQSLPQSTSASIIGDSTVMVSFGTVINYQPSKKDFTLYIDGEKAAVADVYIGERGVILAINSSTQKPFEGAKNISLIINSTDDFQGGTLSIDPPTSSSSGEQEKICLDNAVLYLRNTGNSLHIPYIKTCSAGNRLIYIEEQITDNNITSESISTFLTYDNALLNNGMVSGSDIQIGSLNNSTNDSEFNGFSILEIDENGTFVRGVTYSFCDIKQIDETTSKPTAEATPSSAPSPSPSESQSKFTWWTEQPYRTYDIKSDSSTVYFPGMSIADSRYMLYKEFFTGEIDLNSDLETIDAIYNSDKVSFSNISASSGLYCASNLFYGDDSVLLLISADTEDRILDYKILPLAECELKT